MTAITDERLAQIIELVDDGSTDAGDVIVALRELTELRAYTETQKRTIELQGNELRSLERDAARYRWLRNGGGGHAETVDAFGESIVGEWLDKAVDNGLWHDSFATAIAEQAKDTPPV